jgi:hypothetical protein
MELRVSGLRGILMPMTLAKFGKASEMKRQSGPKRAKVVKFYGAVSSTTAVPLIADDYLHRRSRRSWANALNRFAIVARCGSS